MALLIATMLTICGCHYSTRCLTGRSFFPCAIERCGLQFDVDRVFEFHVIDTEGNPQPADVYVDGTLVLAGESGRRLEVAFDSASERYGWLPVEVEVRTQGREPQKRRLVYDDATHQVFYVARLEER